MVCINFREPLLSLFPGSNSKLGRWR